MQVSLESLQDMEEAVVTAATGALGPVLKKLEDLLNYKDKLQEETRIDLEFFRSNLKNVSSLLKNIWEREDLDAECKDWMMEARDMSYAIEDDIDDFKHGLEHGGISFVQQSTNACTFKARKIQVQGLVQRYCEKWKDPETMSTNSRKLTVDKHESELVEMEEKKDELIKSLNEHKTVCIVGFAGMRKTTLANMVYHAIGEKETFECRAFVSLSPTLNTMEVLKTIITNISGTIPLADTDASEELSDNIQKILKDKRYLVVVDDIWHCQELELIVKSLPENKLESRIIMTTHISDVAEKCRVGTDAFVYAIARLSFESLCLGYQRLPLHLKSCLLHCTIYPPDREFERDDLTSIWMAERFVYEEEKARSYFDELVNRGYIRPVERRHTEVQKYEIKSKMLAFLNSQSQNYNFVVSVGNYTSISSLYDRKIYRVSIQGDLSSADFARLDFSHTRSFAIFGCANLIPFERMKRLRVLLIDEQCSSKNVNSGDDDPNMGIDNHVNIGELLLPRLWQPIRNHCQNPVLKPKFGREITVLPQEIEEMQCLEILCISSTRIQRLPREIGKLHLLKYLNISNTMVKVLPREIAGLQNLKTLNMSNTKVVELPRETGKLRLLEFLNLSNTKVEGLPREIKELQELKTLNMSKTKVTQLPREILKLQFLNTLDLSNTMVKELPEDVRELHSLKALNICNTKVEVIPREIVNLQHLETLDISKTVVAELPSDVQEPQHLKTLNLSSTKITKLVHEIGKMRHLETLDISNTAVAEIPRDIMNLQLLKILNLSNTKVTWLPQEIGNLQKLKTLDIRNTEVTKLPREINELKSLESLDVRNSYVKELPWEASRLSNSVVVLVGDKDSNQVVKLPHLPHMINSDISSLANECREDLSIILFGLSGVNWEPLSCASFKVARSDLDILTCLDIPTWVRTHLVSISSLDIRLWKLEPDNIEFLEQMPYLRTLLIQIELIPSKTIAISTRGFTRLESFCMDCRLPAVSFQPGAMPKLKIFELKLYPSRATEDPVGIKHLLELQRVVFLCSAGYSIDAPGPSAAINKVRKEAKGHSNEITLIVSDGNDCRKELIGGSKMRADSSEDNCINTASGTSVIEMSILPGSMATRDLNFTSANPSPKKTGGHIERNHSEQSQQNTADGSGSIGINFDDNGANPFSQIEGLEVQSAPSNVNLEGQESAGGKNRKQSQTAAKLGESTKFRKIQIEKNMEKLDEKRNKEDDYSIEKCIDVVDSMEDLTDEQKADAIELFQSENNRQIFMMTKIPNVRLIWLKKKKFKDVPVNIIVAEVLVHLRLCTNCIQNYLFQLMIHE